MTCSLGVEALIHWKTITNLVIILVNLALHSAIALPYRVHCSISSLITSSVTPHTSKVWLWMESDGAVYPYRFTVDHRIQNDALREMGEFVGFAQPDIKGYVMRI